MVTLDQLQGLTGAKRTVRGLASPNAGAHAVLLYGAEGAGKSTLAKVLAQQWLCTEPSEDGACGECRSCASFDRGQNADFLVIGPVGASQIIRLGAISSVKPKTQNLSKRAGLTSSTDSDDEDYPLPLVSFFRTPPLRSRSKVVLIEPADRMNSRAANALLKTLEEPHPYAKLILTTNAISQILPTILSRCLVVSCELPQSTTHHDPLHRLAGGAPGVFNRLAENRPTFVRLIMFAESLSTLGPEHALVCAEEFKNICGDIETFEKLGARQANTYGLKLLASAISDPLHVQSVVEAHRRVLGNGNAALIFDSLFAQLLKLN